MNVETYFSKAEHINAVQLYIRMMNVETYFSKDEHINVVQLYIRMMNVETYFSQAEHIVAHSPFQLLTGWTEHNLKLCSVICSRVTNSQTEQSIE